MIIRAVTVVVSMPKKMERTKFFQLIPPQSSQNINGLSPHLHVQGAAVVLTIEPHSGQRSPRKSLAEPEKPQF
jgi:hypothetical protein